MFCALGLWSKWNNIAAFTILTKEADSRIADLHHRMPVIVDEQHYTQWFSGDTNDALDLVRATASSLISSVSNDVGKVQNDYAGLKRGCLI